MPGNKLYDTLQDFLAFTSLELASQAFHSLIRQVPFPLKPRQIFRVTRQKICPEFAHLGIDMGTEGLDIDHVLRMMQSGLAMQRRDGSDGKNGYDRYRQSEQHQCEKSKSDPLVGIPQPEHHPLTVQKMNR
jgi:hypothetical protein